MPADITGTEILDEEHGHRALRFVKGPIFAQIILADEINRTPPKTQAALLEAMQEYTVTASGRSYPLERPFFVLATQNPIELEGTYPLPEAQLDRFLFNVVMTYLSEDDEVQVVTDTTSVRRPEPMRVLDGAEILAIQDYVRQVLVAEEVVRYAVRLTDSSRPGRGAKLDFIEKWVKWGAGLRASHALVIGAKARALLHGRHHVVGERHPGAGQADPAPPRAAELLRRGRRHHGRPHRRSAARRGAGARQRVVAPWLARPATSIRRSSRGLARSTSRRRTIVEGFLTGLHRSPYKGFSVEFAEYRQYIPGDDLATLDWKVYARSDRHFVKKFEEETNLTCHLLLDVSGSMGYGERRHHQAAIRLVPDRRAGVPDAPAARLVRVDRV